MLNSLREVVINYGNDPLLGDKVHVIARKGGKVVFNDYFKIYASIETNYSRLYIDWPQAGVLPMEYQDHYGSSMNKYPVNIEYFEEEDIVHLSGKYIGASYKIVVQLPEKRF